MDAEKLIHYDAHCPRCRKATRVQRKMVEATFPNWREALKELETQVDAFADAPQGAPASTPKPQADSAPKAESKPKAETAKKPAAKKKSA
jgi:hypothetical protein